MPHMLRLRRCVSALILLATVSLVASSPLSLRAADPEAEKKAEELVKVADEAKARAEQLEKALKEAQAKAIELQSMLTKLKAEVPRAEQAIKDNEGKLKPEMDKVTAADTAKKAADQAYAAARTAADAAKKAAEEAEKKAKDEEAKAAAATKALTDAQAALKAVTDAVAAAKASVEQAKTGVAGTEKQIADYKPMLDQVQAQFAAVSKEHIDKRRAAEKSLIEIGKLVSFAEKVAPIFNKRCLACHNAKSAKGRYNMETYAGIVKGGESGAAVVPGKADESVLLSMILDGSMPKDADPLSNEQKEIVKQWINTGAVLDAGFAVTAPLIQVMPKETQPPAPEAYPVPIPVTAVAFNQDGSLVATSGYHEVVLWKADDGSLVKRIGNIAERVYDMEFTADGSKLIIAAGTPAQIGEAKIINVADGAILGDLIKTDDAVFGVALSADGKRLATAGADRSIRIFDFETQQQLLVIEDHADWVMDIAWSPDGSKLASASRDKTSKVFDTKTGDSLVTFNGHGQPVYGVGFAPDGSQIVTSGGDRQLRVWQTGDAKQVRNMALGGDIFRLAVTPDGKVFSCSGDKTARAHQIGDGKQTAQYSGHTDWVYSVAVHAGAKKVAGGGYNGEVRLWNLDDGKELLKFIAAPGFKPTEPAK